MRYTHLIQVGIMSMHYSSKNTFGFSISLLTLEVFHTRLKLISFGYNYAYGRKYHLNLISLDWTYVRWKLIALSKWIILDWKYPRHINGEPYSKLFGRWIKRNK